MERVAGPKSVSSDLCKRSFNNSTCPLSHCEKRHYVRKYSYYCEDCDTSFSRKIRLEKHKCQHLSLKCNVCNFTFRCKSDLEKHLKKCEKSKVINKKAKPSDSKEDGEENLFKLSNSLLQSEKLVLEELTDEIFCINANTSFSFSHLSILVQNLKLTKFPLEFETLKSVIYIEKIIEEVLRSSSAAQCSENKFLHDVHSYLLDLSTKHFNQ